MRSKVWTVFSVVIVLTLLLAPVATYAQSLNIAWIHSNAAAQSEQRARAGFEQYLKEQGWNWQISYSDGRGSGERLAALLEDAVQRGADAIIVSMADLRAARAALDMAREANIPVFAIDSGWVPGVLVDVTSNNWLMSAKISSYLIDSLGGQGNIIFFRMAEHHGTRKRGDVMETMLKEFPGIRVLAEHNIDYTNFYEDTLRTMEDYIERFGDQIDAVWAPWDEPAQAAATALMAHGYTRDDVFVTGIDGHPSAIQEMSNPNNPFKATVAQAFELMGIRTAEWIHAIVVEGRNPDEVIPDKTVYLRSPLVTPNNMPEEGQLPWQVDDTYSQ